MSQALPNSVNSPTSEQEKPTKQPWQRQEGESMLWFNRYKRYQSLGPKRSLQAAVEQERTQITALKSTNERQKQTGKRTRKNKASSVSHLSEVPPVKSVQVPGSWKQASIKWNWVERTRAFDADLINRTVEKHLREAVTEKHTFPYDRVRTLNALFDATLEAFNTTKNKTPEQICAYTARIQSILRDIRAEMALYNEDVARLVLHTRISKEYQGVSEQRMKALTT